MTTVTFPYEQTRTGYSAFASTHSILVTGATLEELGTHAQEALQEQCDYMNESGEYPKQDITQFQIELVPFVESIHGVTAQ